MAISAGVESTVTATTATQKERNKKQTTHQAQKQLSKRACCLCAWQIEKARKAGQYLPLFVPIGTLSRRTKSLRSSGVLKAV
jgi:hypothetical protein